MAVGTLSSAKAGRLRAAQLTYESVGATVSGRPPGYHWLERAAPLVRRDFEAACADLFGWRLQQRAGLRVETSELPLREGTVVLMHLGIGPASIRIPCRVVYVVDEPRLRGFAYGTLAGHPEQGEERFTLEQEADGSITVAISAFSRPASRLARLGGPFTRQVQRLMADRYLRALARR